MSSSKVVKTQEIALVSKKDVAFRMLSASVCLTLARDVKALVLLESSLQQHNSLAALSVTVGCINTEALQLLRSNLDLLFNVELVRQLS